MTQEQLRMQMLAGIITESQYKEKVEEFNANYGPGRADYPGNVSSGDNYKVEETIKHPKSGIEAKVYSNGIIEFCKDENGKSKRLTAYKYSSESNRKGGFESVKEFFKKNEEIEERDLFNKSGIQYEGTLLKIRTSSSNKCGEDGLKTISWVR